MAHLIGISSVEFLDYGHTVPAWMFIAMITEVLEEHFHDFHCPDRAVGLKNLAGLVDLLR